MQWLERELSFAGLSNIGPCMERIRIFSEAFAEVIDVLPTYRPFLLALQKEYDGLIQRLQADFHAVAPLEGRLKTMRAESLSFVGESMTWFQMEIDRLRKALLEAEAGREQWKVEAGKAAQFQTKLKESSEKDKAAAFESHHQNLDILRHLERCEKQVELLRKQEKDFHIEVKELEQKLEVTESRIETVTRDLNEEREKLRRMVPKENLEALREELRKWEAKCTEWQEMYAAKEKDYLKIVETYSKKVGQQNPRKHDLRPLTPRPSWSHCRGLLDPDAPHSVDKAEVAQHLLQHVSTCARALLSAYGLDITAQKSAVFQAYSTHKLAVPLSGCFEGEPLHQDAMASRGSAKGLHMGLGRCGEASPSRKRSCDGEDIAASSAEEAQESVEWPPDASEDTPPPLRHLEPVKNLGLSRKRVGDFVDDLMHRRNRIGSSSAGVPFLEYMLSHLQETLPCEEQAMEFAVNIFCSVRRYSVEPDFLAYLLLLLGKIPDTIVRDNKQLCGELLRIFISKFEPLYGGRTMTKQKFFFHLREVLQNKDPKILQELVTSLPAGGPETQLNYERLFLDDTYVLSPVVYTLRLQHLEEVLDMADRLEKTVQGAMPDGSRVLKYGPVEAALRDDPTFELLQVEDYARAFGVGVGELEDSTQQELDAFMELMKTGEVFHIMFFPSLPSDDADLADGLG